MTQVTGMNELLRNLKGLSVDIPKAIDEAVVEVALDVKADAVKSIQQVSAGGVVTRYTQGGNSFDHMVSKEGDAPNTDTGRLASSIAMSHDQGSGEAHVSTDVDYAEHLEFGTVKMAARPFLEPALDKNEKNLLATVGKAIQRQLPKAAI